MLINAQSLFLKIDEVRLIADIRCPTTICITETWLNDCIDSSLVNIHNYRICRSDRNYRRGGGTAVFLQSDIIFAEISSDLCMLQDVDYLMLDVKSIGILLVCVYVPPSVSSDTLQCRSKLNKQLA